MEKMKLGVIGIGNIQRCICEYLKDLNTWDMMSLVMISRCQKKRLKTL